MNAPFQIDIFGSTIATLSSSPIGLAVILPKLCGNCGSDIATIGSSAGPYYARLNCECCGGHRGWLSGATYLFISDVITNFGRPTESIEIRRNQPVPITDTTVQAVTATALTAKGT
jgi:hypothetical protein